MPELPEVETIVRDLRPELVGLKLRDAWVDKEKVLKQAGGLKKFNKEIKGKKILSVRRRAKYIILDIEGPKTLFIHQKISGHLMYGKWKLDGKIWKSILKGPLKDDPKNQHIRLVLGLSNGYQLALGDLRRFGKVILVNDDQLKNLKEIQGLGPEPLEINFAEFKKRFEKKKGKIKQVLLDPKFVVGIGNIYGDEILWHAGIHPEERAEKLTEADIKKIYKYTREVLKEAIRRKGSSMDDYRRPTGKMGSFQLVHRAYHKTDEKCAKRDGGIIKRITINARSAHFCPVHQPLK